MQLRSLALVLFGALLSTTAACETRVSLGTPCTSTSQCNDGLICSFGRCRAGCERQTDCEGAQVCVQESGLGAVCTLVDDTCEGANRCSAGLVCSVSICVAPCSTMSCVEGSSCTTVSASEVCVRDDIIASCTMGAAAVAAPSTIDAIIGGRLETRVDELFVPGVPARVRTFPLMIAVGLRLRTVWVAATTMGVRPVPVLTEHSFAFDGSAYTGGTDLSVSGLGPGIPGLARFSSVSGMDILSSQDQFSTLFTRTHEGIEPGENETLFALRLRREAITAPIEPTELVEPPSNAHPTGVLFDGLAPLISGDTVAIAVAVQPNRVTPEASGVLLSTGARADDTTLAFPTMWPSGFTLRGTHGAFAALNARNGELRIARVDAASRALPTTWAYVENRSLSTMDITNAVDAPGEFVVATTNGCSDVLLTRIVCTSECVATRLVRVPVSPTTTDLHLVTLSLGYALVDLSPDGASITWLDRDMNFGVPRASLFNTNHDFATAAGLTLSRIAVDAGASGLYAIGLYNYDDVRADTHILGSAFFATP